MSSYPPAEATTADPPERVERQLRELRQMTALCLRLATAVVEQAENPSADRPAVCPDPGLTLTRLARAVRLNEAMETKIEEGRLARELAADAERAARRAEAERVQTNKRIRGWIQKTWAEGVVERMIEADAEERGERGERQDAERLLADLHERLTDDDDSNLMDFAERPFAEMVQRLCQDLGVTFDPDLLDEEDRDALAAVSSSPFPSAGQGGPAWAAAPRGVGPP